MNRFQTAVVVSLGAAAAASPAVAGPDWVEIGDAGSLVSEAQAVVGVGQLNSIQGTLSNSLGAPDYEDMYLIEILSPTTFFFDLSAAQFDTRVFLFNVTLAGEAFGLLANDDTNAGTTSFLTGLATDGSGAKVTQPGVYAIAITGQGRYPVSRTGPIFVFQSSTEISGPDGPGGINPHEGWDGQGTTGSYNILVQGIGFVDIPAPGAGACLVLAGLLTGRRRR